MDRAAGETDFRVGTLVHLDQHFGVARLEREGDGTVVLHVRVDVPEHTITQTPVVTPVSSIRAVDVRIPRGFGLASAATNAAAPTSATREFPPVEGSLRARPGIGLVGQYLGDA